MIGWPPIAANRCAYHEGSLASPGMMHVKKHESCGAGSGVVRAAPDARPSALDRPVYRRGRFCRACCASARCRLKHVQTSVDRTGSRRREQAMLSGSWAMLALGRASTWCAHRGNLPPSIGRPGAPTISARPASGVVAWIAGRATTQGFAFLASRFGSQTPGSRRRARRQALGFIEPVADCARRTRSLPAPCVRPRQQATARLARARLRTPALVAAAVGR